MTCFNYTYTDELYHHGIKGQKWGVRRYQNEDGTYTKAGKERRLKQGAKAYKGLVKDIRNRRASIYGKSNRWVRGLALGEHSYKLKEESGLKRSDFYASPEYQKWLNSYDRNKDEQDETYYDRWMSKQPKKNFDDVDEWIYVVGKGYADDYIHRGGRTMSIAYLEDMGFDNKEAVQLVDELLKSNKTLATV